MERFINILIIDNDPVIQSGLKNILIGRGNNLLYANSIEEAIPIVQKKEIGIFLLNIEDVEEGINSVQILKENKRLENSYIIVVAKEDATGSKLVKGMHMGAVDYITYPFNPNLVKSKIEVFKSLFYKDQRIGQLLNNIFPSSVLEELQTNGKFSPKKIDNGIVIFTDFVDFSLKSKSLKPIHLIQTLEKYFIKFDEIILKYNLEKIKTIGDAYMALAGVTENNPEPAIRACLAAIELRNYMITEQETAIALKKDYWELRIGMHMGPLVTGIIGATKYNYDVWGDTVNIASRTEASTKNNSISITKSIHDAISNYFITTPRGKIDIKKRGGSIEMYYLEEIVKDFSMYKEGNFPNTNLRVQCGLAPMDFKQMRTQIINKLKSQLPDQLSYHDVPHSLDVEKAVIRYAKLEGVEKEDILLLRTAALIHDVGFMARYEDNEDFAIEFAKTFLPQFGYSQKQIEVIASMIHATKHSVEPKNLLEEIIIDADYDYLGRPDYIHIVKKLRSEMKEYGTEFSDIEWLKYQLEFLENTHQYYTQTAKNIRDIGKQNRIKRIKKQLEDLST